MIPSNKLLPTILLMFCSFIPLQSQQVDKVFVSMPDIILPTLNKEIKLELMEYYKAGLTDTIQNLFNKNIFVTDYDSVSRHIQIQSAENARFEMKLFLDSSNKNDTAIYYFTGVIYTVCAPVCSSYIKFYDKEWNPFNINLPEISTADWLTNKDMVKDGVKITDMINTSFLELHFSKDTEQVVIKNNFADTLTDEDRILIEPYLIKADKKISVTVSSKEKLVLQF
ncbi:MAG: DUF3256 family protein [Paludibacteraceae bacterium]